MRNARLAAALIAMTLASATTAHAREEPLWEAGLGVAGLRFPDYRGASESRNYAFPTPYFIYRGDFFKADRYGVRGVFYRTDRIDLNLSIGASLPVRSSDSPARSGMPDLKPAFELGPSLQYTVWRSPDERVKLDLRLPLRGAVTIESSPRFVGTQFFPNLNLDIHDPAGFTGWNLGFLAGPVYTDARYNRYFYEVQPAYATASRPAYEPKGGYGGMEFIAALSRRYPKFWMGGFIRYDTLRGAVFEDSPLVTSKKYVAGGIGFAWILGASSQRVPVTDYGDERK